MSPQLYPVEPGLLAGEYPGDPRPERAVAKLEWLVAQGVRTIIDLTRAEDGLAPYIPQLVEAAAHGGHDLTRLSFPVPDMGVPESPGQMRAILLAIRHNLEAGRGVYVHCWGGIGRTGTVIGCWLREHGASGDAALARVQALYAAHMAKVAYHPHSPQTAVQCAFVCSWVPVSGARPPDC